MKTIKDLFENKNGDVIEYKINDKNYLFIERNFDFLNKNRVLVELIDKTGDYIETINKDFTLDTKLSELDAIIG